MKKDDSKLLGCAVFICCVIFLFCFSAQAAVQEDTMALMLEMSPPEGGSLNIVPGVHSYNRFAEVTLVATPKLGYRFVYWMGNVSNAATGTTTVFLDSPKMVIAVFERDVIEMIGQNSEMGGLEADSYASTGGDGSGGGGGLVPSGGTSDSSLEEAGGGQRPHSQHYHYNPPPVPEPTTIALFSAGLLMLKRNRRNGAKIV